MKIGIIGTGDVGKTLAAGFAQDGHDVVVGSRDPAQLDAWRTEHAKVRTSDVASAVRDADVVVLAVKGSVAGEALGLAGADALGDKIVIDACNPIADTAPVDGVLTLFTRPDESLMERSQRAYPRARFVKAFNSVGSPAMVRPKYAQGPPTMFVCGDDAGAKKTVTQLLEAFGWETADMGGAVAARAIEPLCVLWCIPGFRENSWTHAFKLLH
jgi:predicted dinucleotide-binding enzyme